MADGRSTGIATEALGQAGTGHALPMPHIHPLDGRGFSPRPRAGRFGGYSEDQVYDNAGNPTTYRNNGSQTFNYSNQRSNTGFTYDGNGNPTTYKTKTNTYDRENRLLSYDSGDQTNGYRPDNLRAWRDDSNGTKFFLYDGGSVICELDSDGDVVASNAFAPDGLVSRTEGEVTMEYLFDLQGNVSTILKSNEEVSIHFGYNAWGDRVHTFPDPGELKYDIEQPFSYNGRWGYYRDAETGLYYCQNRYYDPDTGRWLTRDPIGFAGGVNVYNYGFNGPVMGADPSGLFIISLGIEGGIGAGFGIDLNRGVYYDTDTGDWGFTHGGSFSAGATVEANLCGCIGYEPSLKNSDWLPNNILRYDDDVTWTAGGGSGPFASGSVDLTGFPYGGYGAKFGPGAGVDMAGSYDVTGYFSVPRTMEAERRVLDSMAGWPNPFADPFKPLRDCYDEFRSKMPTRAVDYYGLH